MKKYSAHGPPAQWRRRPIRRCPKCTGAACTSCICRNPCRRKLLIGNRAITRKHPDWLRLTLANSIYGGAFNSRLVMNIREQKGYTYSPRSGAHPLRQHGYFSIGAAVRNDVVAATLTEIFYEIDRMRSTPVGEEELDDARNYLTGVFSLGLATQDGLAGQLATSTLEKLAGRLSGNVSRARLETHVGGRARRGAEIFRFGQRANRDRRRPRADRIASRAVRQARGVRCARESDLRFK